MSAKFSEGLVRYLDEEKPYATVATVLPDGRPHLTVVWVLRDGDDLLISTTSTRQQGRNLLRDPRITVMVNPPATPFLYAEIRGTAEVTEDADHSVLNRVARKYTGQDYIDFNPDSVNDGPRLVVRVKPEKITGRL
ncbi:PPOX class F420-dependent oxidoreductase [Streptacidiphilus monticola]|uniref:PPOX class F420-dependent oxidoreductase n=1 Tax=Streptacidiphilus monticola TaxID=2161674 RepID=A0ABW1GBA0_9ACTN